MISFVRINGTLAVRDCSPPREATDNTSALQALACRGVGTDAIIHGLGVGR